jgi:hypothetical protein
MPETVGTCDHIEITQLLARLASVLDERRYEDIHTVYAADVVVHAPRGDLHGIEEVLAFLRRPSTGEEHTQHVNGGVLISTDGGQVRASANQLVTYYRTGEPPHRRSGLRLSYTAVRTPAGWRFDTGRITLAWTEPS